MLRRQLAHAAALEAHCEAQAAALETEMAEHAEVAQQLREGKENATALGGVRGAGGGGASASESAAAAIIVGPY